MTKAKTKSEFLEQLRWERKYKYKSKKRFYIADRKISDVIEDLKNYPSDSYIVEEIDNEYDCPCCSSDIVSTTVSYYIEVPYSDEELISTLSPAKKKKYDSLPD